MKRWLLPLLVCLTGCSNYQDIAYGGGLNHGAAVIVPQAPPQLAAAQARFLDISATGQALSLTDDDSAVVDLGFPFPVQGQLFTQVSVCSNGFLTFGSGDTSFVNNPLPSNLAPTRLLAVYWTDLATPGAPWIFTQTQGVAPNRQFVVQWKNAQSAMGTPKGITFEAILKEDGSAEFQYLDTSFGAAQFDAGALATVGLQAGGLGVQQCFNGSAAIGNNTGYRVNF